MKILYGVQATGQGHISRARAMASALAGYDVDVTWLLSGRPRDKLFDMKPFGHFEHRRGMSFASRAGKIDLPGTIFGNNLPRFIYDVTQLDVEPYDIVVTDFEPVTAWASHIHGKRSIGIGHQYAFGDDTPSAGGNWLTESIMRNFAPVSEGVGLHWHPYAANVLPPILDLPELEDTAGDYILVYLPFEDQAKVTAWLNQFPEQAFKQYAASLSVDTVGNVDRFRANVSGFKLHLRGCKGVICNSGFELISECLQWHKPVLTKPLHGQMEQVSNALALERLHYARTIKSLDSIALADWLARDQSAPKITFPDVAATLAKWLAGGATEDIGYLNQGLWVETGIPLAPQFPGAAPITRPAGREGPVAHGVPL